MKLFLMLSAILVISGCATPYQSSGITGGYKDKEISPGKFEVYYLGNGATSFEKVEEYWHRRASELCHGKKYNYTYTNTNCLNRSNMVAVGTTFVPIYVSYPQLLGVVECKDE